ncbi:PCI domain-containing protein, partial [Candidatus Woesearchaeota archaeon]|nr:PCI domain-containing protein [Candidatus Woesearchaeota archaeon]
NDFLRKNTRTLLRNLLNIVLLSKPRTIEEMSAIIGVKEKELEKFLNAMIKEGKMKKEGDLYSAVKQK